MDSKYTFTVLANVLLNKVSYPLIKIINNYQLK